MQLVRVDPCLFFNKRDNTFLQIMIRAREAKIKKNTGLITLKCIPVSMKIVFDVLAWSAHQSLVRKWCSLGTSLSISNNTITLYRREFSLSIHDIRRISVIGKYS